MDLMAMKRECDRCGKQVTDVGEDLPPQWSSVTIRPWKMTSGGYTEPCDEDRREVCGSCTAEITRFVGQAPAREEIGVG